MLTHVQNLARLIGGKLDAQPKLGLIDVGYDVTVTAVQATPQQILIQWLAVFTCKSPILGAGPLVTLPFNIPSPHLTGDQAGVLIATALEQLRQQVAAAGKLPINGQNA